MQKTTTDVLRAAFVLPFSAGIVKDRRNAGFARHDGSIAGIVLLTTAVIMIFETIIILPIGLARQLIVGLSILASICLLVVSVLAKCHFHWTRRRSVKPVDHIKMKFLWFFCVGNIVFQLLQLIMHQVCHIRNNEVIVYWLSTWIFEIIQTVFIQYFSKFKFANVLCLYYGLLILFVSNISNWTQQIVYTYRVQNTPFVIPNSSIASNDTNLTCSGEEWIVEVVVFLKPFLEPFLLEYSLLSLIFLSEMWPKKNQDRICVSIEEIHGTEENNECDPLIQFHNLPNEQPRSTWSRGSISVLVVGIIYSMFFSVLQCIFIYVPSTDSKQFTTFLYIIFFIANIVRTPVIVKCFHAMSGQLKPKHDNARNISLNQIIIIISSFATCGFYFLELSKPSRHISVLYLINSVVRNIATIFQTLFILQMKHYKKTGTQTHFSSVQNTFLFVSLVNLGIWVSCTFVNPRFVSHPAYSFLDSLWFPFVIFYHFESFIAFYRFFRA